MYLVRKLAYNKKSQKLYININHSAPIRPYVQVLSMVEENDTQTPKHLIDKIDNKKFYLENKD